LVYPDRKHVSYINSLTNCLDEMLPKLGFKLNKLCDTTPPNEHFGGHFEKLAEECILGIVVLDGFRPNVLFEYGFLRGKGKVILPIQDRRACISIKSLYSIMDRSDENNIKSNTGLTKAQFTRLKEPPIGYFCQISDRHGINVVVVDCLAELCSAEHPKRKIEAEIKKLMPRIIEKYTNQSLKSIKQKIPQYLEKFQEVTLKILQYYTHARPFNYNHIEKILRETSNLEREASINLPSATYSIIASLCATLAEQTIPSNTDEAAKLYRKAIKLHDKVLEIETDGALRASSLFKIGYTYDDFSEIRDTEPNLKKAIKAYEEALAIYTKEDFPIDYAMVRKNLEIAYTASTGNT
jgi:tetratricopeptide (TPR) repeat protein